LNTNIKQYERVYPKSNTIKIMTTIANPEQFRTNIRSKLAAIVGNSEILATNIEKGVFNYSVREATSRKIVKKWENTAFVQIYLDRLRSLYVNLKNPDFLAQITSGDFTPNAIAFMTHQEFNPKHWADNIQRKMKRDASKYNAKIEASTDMFTCRRCKSTRCTYYELQTRSADESATVFITCLDCGKHWKS